MTLVNRETGEITEVTYADVRTSIDTAKAKLEEAAEQIVWQVEHRVWVVLGYSDWNEMREAEYGGAAFMVPREDRPELVTRMRKAGLTNVQIADTAGVSEATVRNDLNRNSAIEVPDEAEPVPVINSRGQSRPATYTKPDPEPHAQPAPAPAESSAAAVNDFIESDVEVRLTSWRKHFMAAIAKSGELMLFDPADVADKADVDLVNELERLSQDLNNYVSRVHAKRPHRLTAIRGGVQ